MPDLSEESFLFGVFDGHGGKKVSNFVAANYQRALQHHLGRKGDKLTNITQSLACFDALLRSRQVNSHLQSLEESSPTADYGLANLAAEIDNCEKPVDSQDEDFGSLDSKSTQDEIEVEGFSCVSDSHLLYSLDHGVSAHQTDRGQLIANKAGTTANVLYMEQHRLHFLNVGDSAAVVCRNGRFEQPNKEHSTKDPAESSRILKSGEKLIRDRVRGVINVSRSIGDLDFKGNSKLSQSEQAIISTPDLAVLDLTNDIDFIVLATDGIWNFVDKTKFCQSIAEAIADKRCLKTELQAICEYIVSERDPSEVIGSDNLTCTVIVNTKQEEDTRLFSN